MLSPLFESAEIESWRAECERLARGLEEVAADEWRVQTRGHGQGDSIRDRYDPVSEFSPLFRELAADERMKAIAAAALGSPATLFKDRLILKSSGTHGYGLHRDWPYWEFLGIPPDEMVSLMVSVDATDEENGAVEVFPRLHRMELPASAEDPRDVDPAGVRGVTPVVVGTRGGDVLLLHPMAPHRSGQNRSRGSRRLVTYVFTTTRHADAGARYYAAHPARG